MPEVWTNDGLATVTSGGTGNNGGVGPFTETWTVQVLRAFPSPVAGQQFHVADTAPAGALEKITVPAGCSGAVGTQTWAGVVRGAEGSTPVAHQAGFTVKQVITAGAMAGLGDGVFDVRQFGAAGDGSTDDTAAVRAAITAATAAGGGDVFFPAGQYKCSTVTGGDILTVTGASVRFRGEGWDQQNPTLYGSWLVAGATCTNLINVTSTATTFTMENMGADGAAKATRTLTLAGLNPHVTQCYIRCNVSGGTCINVANGGKSPWIANCRTSNNNAGGAASGTTGILLNDTDGIITGCKPENCTYAIQALTGASGALIIGNHPTPGSTAGVNCVFVNGSPSHLAIIGNRWDNHAFGAAIQITPASNGVVGVVVADNVFFQNTLAAPPAGAMTPAAVQVDTTTWTVYQLVITGNTIPGPAGLTLYSSMLAAAAQYAGTATGVQPTANQSRLTTGGTVVAGNSACVPVFLQSGVIPLVNTANVSSADGTTWSPAGGVFTSAALGDGASTTLTVTHNLGSALPVVQVYSVSGASPVQVPATVTATSVNVVTLTFGSAPATGSIKCVVRAS